MRLIILALSMMFASSAIQAEDTFLEGFPDVPLLPVVKALEDDPVIFDTPSGTVAEARLLLAGTPANAMKSYRESLIALGWGCAPAAPTMVCKREENRLTFTSSAPDAKAAKLILRLEPQK